MIPDEFLSSCRQSIQLARDRRRAARSFSLAQNRKSDASLDESTKVGSNIYSLSLLEQKSQALIKNTIKEKTERSY